MSDAPAPKPPLTESQKRDLRLMVLAAVAGCALGWFAATSPASPIKPHTREYPILHFIARVAKVGLWVMWAAEPPPQQRAYIVHARVDEDGNRIVNHGEGW